jgi:hypothetical protein
MNQLINKLQKIERFIGQVKFAVIIILAFALIQVIGTFVESYHGTDYANRLVYKAWPFMLVQFLMFLSIFYATVLRFPMKKRLAGFYVLHLGLLLLFIGSFVTYYAGLDGSITLPPNTPSRAVNVNQDVVKITYLDEDLEATYSLPYASGPKKLDVSHEKIKLLEYLPFASEQTTWEKVKNQLKLSSAEYLIANDMTSQQFILSLEPDSDFNSTTQMGPLNIHYMPEGMASCFKVNNHSKLLVWDAKNSVCYLPEDHDGKVETTKSGKRFLVIKIQDELLKFFPEMGPLPLDEKFEMNQQSNYRVFSKKLFEKSAHLFLFGPSIAYFNKDQASWQGDEFTDQRKKLSLPWMNFELSLINYSKVLSPRKTPAPTKPIQDNNEIIHGDIKAVKVQALDKSFWVTNTRPLGISIENKKVKIELTNEKMILPYQLNLVNFKMDTDPGTNNPASYESFISLFDGKTNQKHHIYMNNPLKYNSFTFYQASYFKTEQGYGSVLSVNYDPGRFLKYLGSLLLVLGSIWHFGFARMRKKNNNIKAPIEALSL